MASLIGELSADSEQNSISPESPKIIKMLGKNATKDQGYVS
jgi:hypothetical protein|tara:strand:+ start:309 stop:431 length:123 start_codon:yes stop_codon:yes gene_type:complete